jgi:YD repeat-containing protein
MPVDPPNSCTPTVDPPAGSVAGRTATKTTKFSLLPADLVLTTPARTALDIACRYPPGPAIAAIDALARATKLKTADVEMLAQRYRGRRGIRAALEALDLVDAGAESPQETRVRLVLVKAGFPRPETQIPVYDEYGQLVAVIDMGWRDLRVGVDYDGAHHRMSRRQFDRDVRRYEAVAESGWDDVRITGEDTDGSIIGRVGRAFDRRT